MFTLQSHESGIQTISTLVGSREITGYIRSTNNGKQGLIWLASRVNTYYGHSFLYEYRSSGIGVNSNGGIDPICQGHSVRSHRESIIYPIKIVSPYIVFTKREDNVFRFVVYCCSCHNAIFANITCRIIAEA